MSVSVKRGLTVIPGGDLSDMERARAGLVGVLRPARGVSDSRVSRVKPEVLPGSASPRGYSKQPVL